MNNVLPRFDHKTILLVETKDAIAAAIEQCLQDTGATVVQVASVYTAGEKLTLITPNIIITNLQLCQESGFTLLNQVRTYERILHQPQMPMIAIADHSDEEGNLSLNAGFQAYLRTPLMAASLYATLRQFV